MLVLMRHMFERRIVLITLQGVYFTQEVLTIHTTVTDIPHGTATGGINVYVKLQNVFPYLHKILRDQAQKQ